LKINIVIKVKPSHIVLTSWDIPTSDCYIMVLTDTLDADCDTDLGTYNCGDQICS